MFFGTMVVSIIPTFWMFMMTPAGIVFMIIMTLILLGLWAQFHESVGCKIGCVIFLIIFIALIVMGVKGAMSLIEESNTRENSTSNMSSQNTANRDLDLEDLKKLMHEVENGNEEIFSEYTKADLRIFRNMLFAEKGYRITKAGLKEYFENKSWYRPYIDNQDDIELNETEKDFLKKLKKYEDNN